MAYAHVSFFDAIGTNKRNSILLIVVFFIFFMLIVATFSYVFDLGIVGVLIGFIALLFYAAFAYFQGDQTILAISGAQPLDPKAHPFIYNVVEGLSAASGIPMPKLYIINDPAPNAFAIGRNPQHAHIAVTRGLLEKLSREELEGVLAHEVSHIANYDVRFALLAVVLVGAIALLANIATRSLFYGRGNRRGGHPILLLFGIILLILAPVFSELLRLALSRQREYLADANGAKLTRYPEGLARALEKISAHREPVRTATETTAPLYFSNPLSGRFGHLFSSHPNPTDRIRRLRSM